MLERLTSKIYLEYKNYSKSEKLFILFIMLCSFAITAEAAITRSVSNSFFIDIYGPAIFPYAWIASLPLNYAIVHFYNKFIPRFGCGNMMGVVLFFTIIFNITCVFLLKKLYFLPFLLYLWKDIFIIFMFHNLWSVINSTINISRAKYLYGFFYGIGGIGSVVGSLFPSFFAVSLGTEKLLVITLPFYLITYICYSFAISIREKSNSLDDISMDIDNGNMSYGLNLIKNSRWLKFILILVIGMQVSSTILDYQFSLYLKRNITTLDLRTEFMGRLFSIVNSINIFLQFFGSVVLLRLLGLRKTHMIIPFFLLANSILFFLFPSFSLICLSFGMIKSLDYSIFGIVKEMLYIPLKIEEKFKAKAIIDVFAYRSSKALASLIILGLTMTVGSNISVLLSFLLIVIFCMWIYSIFSMKDQFKQVEQQTPRFVK